MMQSRETLGVLWFLSFFFVAHQLHLPCESYSCMLGSAGLPGSASCVVSAWLLPSWPLQRMGYGTTGWPKEPAALVPMGAGEAPAMVGQV